MMVRLLLWIPAILVSLFFILLIARSVLSKPPSNLGVVNGRLSTIDASKPNNINTYEAGQYPQEKPLTYSDGQEAAKARLLAVIADMPRTEIVTNDGDYIHVTFTSSFFRFVDDVEFLFDDENSQIQFRSASREGYSDIGVNQKRMNAIRKAFE